MSHIGFAKTDAVRIADNLAWTRNWGFHYLATTDAVVMLDVDALLFESSSLLDPCLGIVEIARASFQTR